MNARHHTVESALVQMRKQSAEVFQRVFDATGHQNMLHLIHLRWLAIFGKVLTIIYTVSALDIALPLPPMIAILVCLTAFNIGSHLRWHEEPRANNRALFCALMVDMLSLSGLLYFSGGANNPFIFLFVLQTMLAAVLLQGSLPWWFTVLSVFSFMVLMHFHIPLVPPSQDAADFFHLYVQGLLVCFSLTAILLVYFVTRIMNNLRTGDNTIAEFRQRAVEEESIVRMGLLASGAAHELGTPLATMTVILSDWKSTQPMSLKEPDFHEDVLELLKQLERCKKIVSGILLSAGETRGEGSTCVVLNDWLNDLVHDWKKSRECGALKTDFDLPKDLKIISDAIFKQAILNVLDNAFEASPHAISFYVYLKQHENKDPKHIQYDVLNQLNTSIDPHSVLHIVIQDEGAGFTPEIMQVLGQPYNSNKGREGGGLGLFLVFNVLRRLNGEIHVQNLEPKGASVMLELPLTAIAA